MNSKLKIKKLKLVFCIAISVIAAPLTATAQDITFLPSIAVRGEYNDNVYYSRVIEASDYLARIKPAFTFDYATELFDVQSSFDVDIQRYLDEDDLDTIDQHYDLNAEYQMMERISVLGNCSYAKDTTLESELAETGLAGNPRHDRERYIGGMGFSYMISEISDIRINYSHNKTEYDWERNVDYDVDSISLSFNSRFNNQLDVFTIQPSYYRYDSDISKVNNYSLSFGLLHPFSETLTLTVFAGARYTKTEIKIPINEKDSNWAGVADINLEKTGELYSAAIGYNHDLSYSSYGEPIEKYNLYCNANRSITERLQVNFSGSIYLTKSDGDYDDRDNRYYSVSPSLNYRITENYSLLLAYNYSESYNKVRTNNQKVDRNRVWLELRFRFPDKW